MSKKLIGKLVYIINNVTNQVDTWRCTDVFKGMNNELMYELKDGNRMMILPKRCIYKTYKEALGKLNKS